MPNFISEQQIERALVQKLQHLHGFDSLDCHTEDPEDLNDGSGRANKRDVILTDHVREAAVRLNPHIPAKAVDDALEKVLDRRQAISLVAANQEVYHLLRDGIPVEFDDAKGQKQLEQMLKENATRTDFATRLQGIIDRYNAGSSSADNYFEELVKFTKDLKEESERHIRESLTADELELFDLLKKPRMRREGSQKVRLAAKALLHRLREEEAKVLVQDWFKDSQSKGRVRSAVENVLHTHLPESYDRVIFTEKCNNVFDLMLNYASQGLKWAA